MIGDQVAMATLVLGLSCTGVCGIRNGVTQRKKQGPGMATNDIYHGIQKHRQTNYEFTRMCSPLCCLLSNTMAWTHAQRARENVNDCTRYA